MRRCSDGCTSIWPRSRRDGGQGRTVVITGASAGIGAALAELIGARRASLVLVARRADALNEVAARSTPPSQLTDEDIDEVVRVNIKTALYGMQEVLPHFKSRGAGHVINISSMLGRMPFAVIRSAYSAAKHFLNALTANFRTEVQETHPGIQFSIVSPGVVRTEFGKNARHGGPDSRQLPDSQSAEEVAEVIAGVIESRRADVYTRRGAHDRVVKFYEEIGVDP